MMTGKMLGPENLAIAVEFWCDKLRHPEVITDEEFDEMMGSWDCSCCRVQEPAMSSSQEREFKMLLMGRLKRELSKQDEVELYADFYPMGILDEVCKDVGLKNGFYFPADTTMLVSESEVIVEQPAGREILWTR